MGKETAGVKSYGQVYAGMLSLVLLVSCAPEEVRQEAAEFKVGDVNVVVSYEYYMAESQRTGAATPLSNLFDGDKGTSWSPTRGQPVDSLAFPHEPGCTATLTLTLSKPSHIKRLVIWSDPQKAVDQRRKRPKTVVINAYQSSELLSRSFSDSIAVELDHRKQPQYVDMNKQSYMSLLKSGALTFSVVGCVGVPEAQTLGISELQLELSSSPTFTPSLTMDAIRTMVNNDERFVRKAGTWYIITDVSRDDPFLDTIISHLMFYASQKNNKEAVQLLQTYQPLGTFSGERYSYFMSWYELTFPRKRIGAE